MIDLAGEARREARDRPQRRQRAAAEELAEREEPVERRARPDSGGGERRDPAPEDLDRRAVDPLEDRASRDRGRIEERVLILAPAGRDAALACQVLGDAGLACTACADGGALCREIEAGAGTVILSDEALSRWLVDALLAAFERQEPWSDLPLILVVDGGDASEQALAALAPFANATILARPVRINTLVSTVQTSLRARRRQYEVRGLLRHREETDRRKDEFLAMLGHELRNPLAAIRNSLFILREVKAREAAASRAPGPEPRDTRRLERQRQVIERQVGNLVRMVDDLLDVSRVTLGKIRLDLQTVDLREAVERCLGELGMAALADRRGLALAVESESVLVAADPVRIEQVICNLLQNAVKYTPRGGRVSVAVRAEGAAGVVRVADSGIGIPTDMLPYIFEPFTQLESSRLRSEGGLGLGLPLVRGLVRMHGGRVEALSEGPGQGSEFMVSLPLKPATALRQPRGGGPSRDAAERLSVLIVEDNLDGRESLRELLELWGHRVVAAESGAEGLDKALSEPPGAALIDIGLPDIDGNELARRIRAVLEPERIALIAMTGYGQPEDRRRALEAGFDTYLVKPVDPGDLDRLLAEIARRRGATGRSLGPR
jgi:signal transduction histidine kinase/CheY-like chemotaxis protein